MLPERARRPACPTATFSSPASKISVFLRWIATVRWFGRLMRLALLFEHGGADEYFGATHESADFVTMARLARPTISRISHAGRAVVRLTQTAQRSLSRRAQTSGVDAS